MKIQHNKLLNKWKSTCSLGMTILLQQTLWFVRLLGKNLLELWLPPDGIGRCRVVLCRKRCFFASAKIDELPSRKVLRRSRLWVLHVSTPVTSVVRHRCHFPNTVCSVSCLVVVSLMVLIQHLPWFNPCHFASGVIEPYKISSVSQCLCFFPTESHLLQVFFHQITCIPACSRSTRSPLKACNLSLQSLLRYSLVVHSKYVTEPSKAFFPLLSLMAVCVIWSAECFQHCHCCWHFLFIFYLILFLIFLHSFVVKRLHPHFVKGAIQIYLDCLIDLLTTVAHDLAD